MKLLSCLTLAVLMLVATPAFASCGFPGELVATFPEDGATEVPTNARLFIFADVEPLNPTLNGVSFSHEPQRASVYLTNLSPNTDYELRFGLEGFESTTQHTIRFRTGAGPMLAR